MHKPPFLHRPSSSTLYCYRDCPGPPTSTTPVLQLVQHFNPHILQLFSALNTDVIVGKALTSEGKFCQQLPVWPLSWSVPGFLSHKVPDLTGWEQRSTKPLTHVDFIQYQPQHTLASQAASSLLAQAAPSFLACWQGFWVSDNRTLPTISTT